MEACKSTTFQVILVLQHGSAGVFGKTTSQPFKTKSLIFFLDGSCFSLKRNCISSARCMYFNSNEMILVVIKGWTRSATILREAEQCSGGTRGLKVHEENIPHTIILRPAAAAAAWTNEAIRMLFMLFTENPAIWISQLKLRPLRPDNGFGQPMRIVASVSGCL